MALAHSPKIVTDGLVLYLDAANQKSYPGSGSTWTDLTNNYQGTLINVPSFDNSNLGSIVFNGVDNYANLSGSAGNFATGSVECWLKYTADPPSTVAQQIISRTNIATGTFNIRRRTNNAIDFLIRMSETNSTSLVIGPVLTTNWTHVIGTYDGTTQNLYVNGIAQTPTLISGTVETGGTYTQNIGRNTIDTGYTPVQVSIVKLYNTVLTASNVVQNFNATRSRYGI